MADFSISQFQQHIANLINAAGLDVNKNGVIEAKNGELAKVLSSFGVNESQIGDLLEKTDAPQTATMTSSNEKLYPKDVHKQFVDAYKKYDTMSEEQKYNVRQETIKQAVKNFDELQNVMNFSKKLEILTSVPNFDNIDNAKIKEWITLKMLTFAQEAHKKMSESLEKYNNAFEKYDTTYRTPYDIKSSGCVMTPSINNVADMCILKVRSRIQEFLVIDESSLTKEEYAAKAKELFDDINAMITETSNNIESIAQRNFEQYCQQFEDSMYALENDIIKQWLPPLDDKPHEEEPDTIAIKGAPIEKTFTDVVNNTTTGIEETQSNNKPKDGKFIKDGKVYIRKNGQVYDMQGNKVNI